METHAFPPPTRLGGSVTRTVSSRGVRSTPSAAGASFSIGFFLAFIMFGKEAYRGSDKHALEFMYPYASSKQVNTIQSTEGRSVHVGVMRLSASTHRKSVVTIRGSLHFSTCKPPSISRVTVASFLASSTSSLLANVACDQSNKPARI